ncbi:MAG: hypothetical protein ACP5H8_00075 [Candidatus Micrarchaeia archaeon]
MRYRLSTPCRGSNTFDAIPEGDVELTQEKMVAVMHKAGYEIKLKTDVLVIGKKDDVEVALYRRGKIIIKNVKERSDAEKVAAQLYAGF